MKKIAFAQTNKTPHWVGDGFPVRSIFTYHNLGKDISPFLMMDYAGPVVFPPTEKKLGVGEHPHRGFETVTIVYSGEVEHRDSAGGGGTIREGDVQWMTAASGLVHEEFHGREFAKTGGRFEMVQLWVNLPAKDKMSRPRYQGIKSESIPVIKLKDNAGSVRVIAGQYEEGHGPAKTFSPINLWDIRLKKNNEYEFQVPEDHTTALFVLSGKIQIGDGILKEAELGVLEKEGTLFKVKVLEDTTMLLLGGEPFNEPIVGYGPFVMNTYDEIKQAFIDYESGRMGNVKF